MWRSTRFITGRDGSEEYPYDVGGRNFGGGAPSGGSVVNAEQLANRQAVDTVGLNPDDALQEPPHKGAEGIVASLTGNNA